MESVESLCFRLKSSYRLVSNWLTLFSFTVNSVKPDNFCYISCLETSFFKEAFCFVVYEIISFYSQLFQKFGNKYQLFPLLPLQ